MDPGRYVPRQEWDSNSALAGYSGVCEPELGTGVSYGNTRFMDEGYPGDSVYARGAINQDMLHRGVYTHQTRTVDEDQSLTREFRKHTEPFHATENYHDQNKFHEINSFHDMDRYDDEYHTIGSRDADPYIDHKFDKPVRLGGRERDQILSHHRDSRHRISRERNRDGDYDHGLYSYEFDQERSRRDRSQRHESGDHARETKNSGRDWSPYKQHGRSHSHGRDDRSRSRSPQGRRHGPSHRENSHDGSHNERSERRWEHDRYNESSVLPSATVVVKGLSQKTTEEDLRQILADWGPLHNARIIKERTSGISRGFAFIDFPTVKAACRMIDAIGVDGLLINGRKLSFEYSSKSTGGPGASLGPERTKTYHGYSRTLAPQSDWLCIECGCLNFARRTSCFQCNEGRTDDAPPADYATSSTVPSTKKWPESGPTHVLVVRGLDENADEDMLRYEFSKHAPIKDIRFVRDKFTHVSRGFAFVHFHSVDDATKALEATNGKPLEKNGQELRLAYAKSIHGPGSGSLSSSNLAAAAIEAATFAQQYDAVGWIPKEFNNEEKQHHGPPLEQIGNAETSTNGTAPQSGFVWDEKSGYYYDAASGFYYDGNTGLYYDGNNGIWYSFDHKTQQYVLCTDQSNKIASGESEKENPNASDGLNGKKKVISAPATTLESNKKASLPDAIQAAATAALAAEKKEKERLKEIKLASKTSLLANKKKMNNVLTMWKQRSNEGQTNRVVVNDPSSRIDDKHGMRNKLGSDSSSIRESIANLGCNYSSLDHVAAVSFPSISAERSTDCHIKQKPVNDSFGTGGPVQGAISSGQGEVKADTSYTGSSYVESALETSTVSPEISVVATPFKTDASALGPFAPPVTAGSGKRRFSEIPVQPTTHREPQKTTYRDRAAERRSLHGSSSSTGDDHSDIRLADSKSGGMPFPPGVGRGSITVDAATNSQSYEVITADHAIDERNVGNRMLRSMGWQEGLGLGKDGTGIKEPVQARAAGDRAGLGIRPKKKVVDPSLEAHAGDSYRTKIHKKAIARFRELDGVD